MIYHCEAETGVAVHELMRGLIRMKCGTFFKEYSKKNLLHGIKIIILPQDYYLTN